MKLVVTGTRGIPDIMAGVETHCEELFPRIAAKGVDTTLIRRKDYVRDSLTEWKGVKLVDISAPKRKSYEAVVHTFRAVNKAKKLGADVVIQSFHKTLPSLTQTAVLHVGRDAQVDEERIRRFLGIYQSSSPSYIFMAAMDRCVEFLKNEGKERFEAFAARLEDFHAFAGRLEQIRIPGYEIRGSYGIFDFDRSKILLVPAAHGGDWIGRELREKDHLELEMEAGSYGLALTSVMDTEEGFERLKKALLRIDGELAGEKEKQETGTGYDGAVHNEIVISLREAYDGEKETVLLQESEGGSPVNFSISIRRESRF